MIDIISSVRSISYQLAQDYIENPEADKKMSSLHPKELLLWLEYLAQGNNLKNEYKDFPAWNRSVFDEALQILRREAARSGTDAAAQSAGPAKPERPTICQTDRDLISAIGTIRRVNWEFEQGEITRKEAAEQIARFNNSSVTSWLDYLDSDPKHLVREYNYQLEGWGLNLRDAIKILAFFRDYANL